MEWGSSGANALCIGAYAILKGNVGFVKKSIARNISAANFCPKREEKQTKK